MDSAKAGWYLLQIKVHLSASTSRVGHGQPAARVSRVVLGKAVEVWESATPTHRTAMRWWVVAVPVATALVEMVVEAALPGVQAAAAAVTQEQLAMVCRPMPVPSATTGGDDVGGAGAGRAGWRCWQQWWWTLAWGRTWTTVDLPPSMASRGAGKTGGAGRLGGRRRVTLPLPRPAVHADCSRGPGRRQRWRRRQPSDHKRKQ